MMARNINYLLKSFLVIIVVLFFFNDGYSTDISGTARYMHSNEPIPYGHVEFTLLDDVTCEPILVGTCILQLDGQYSFSVNTTDTLCVAIYPDDEENKLDFIPTYSPNKIDWDQANFIIPNGGNMDVDIYCEYTGEAPIIPTFNSYIVTGKVTKSNLGKVSRATVIVMQDGNAFTCGITDEDGNYTVNVPPGEFDIYVDKLGYVSDTKSISAAGSNDAPINVNFSIRKPGEDNFKNTTPVNFKLSQNYPNPFNPKTTINFDIPVNGNVTLQVFDLSGKEVDVLVNEFRTEGSYSVNFNGESYSSGVYFYRLTVNNFTDTKKMILVK
ncbi:T9SS type A sorting domain-containing protein [Bacteroidota bacterium]